MIIESVKHFEMVVNRPNSIVAPDITVNFKN